jgi:hypothetical protein
LAVPPQQQNEAFFREVDDELRREKIEGFWVQWGRQVAVLLVVALLVLAGFLYWRHRQTMAAEANAERLTRVLASAQQGATAKAAGQIAPLKEGAPAYRAAAALLEVDFALARNDDAKAVAGLKALEADQSIGAPYRQVALVRRTAVEFDRLPPQEVVSRLTPLAQPGAPFFGTAGEMLAVAFLKQNKPDRAGALFAALAKDRMVPDSIRSRAVQMASSLGIDAVELPGEGLAR